MDEWNFAIYLSLVSSIHPSLHGLSVGVQCPLTSSLGEFQAIATGSAWCPGLLPVLLSIAFFLRLFHISVFSIHPSLPAIEFHSCFFFMADVSAPTGRPFTYSLYR